MAYSHPKQPPGVSVPPLVSKGTVCMWCMGIHTQNINIHKTHLKIKNKQKPILPLPIQILNHLMNTCAAWRSSSRGSASRCVYPQHYRVEGSRPIITSLPFLLSDAGICVPPKIDLRGLWKLSLLDWRTWRRHHWEDRLPPTPHCASSSCSSEAWLLRTEIWDGLPLHCLQLLWAPDLALSSLVLISSTARTLF